MTTRDLIPNSNPGVEPTQGYRQRLALAIGIDKYSFIARLGYAVADAQAVANLLRDELGFDQVKILCDEQATRAGILRAVEDSFADTSPEDALVIFFAGHGLTRRFPSGLERGYLAPCDARRGERGGIAWDTCLRMDEIT